MDTEPKRITVLISDNDIKLRSTGGKLPNGRPLLAWIEVSWACPGKVYAAVTRAMPPGAPAPDGDVCGFRLQASTLPDQRHAQAMRGLAIVQAIISGGHVDLTCAQCKTDMRVQKGQLVVANAAPNRHERRRLAKVNGR